MLGTLLSLSRAAVDKESIQRSECASTFPATKSEVEAGRSNPCHKGLTLIDASSTPFLGIQDNASDIGASRINAANYNYQQQSKLPPSNAWQATRGKFKHPNLQNGSSAPIAWTASTTSSAAS